MRKAILSAGGFFCCFLLLFWSVGAIVSTTMPPYADNVGDVNYTEKITGLYLLQESAAQRDNLIIYGSSELRTTEISTHPANFFASKRAGFQVNLIGRGSCQSLIHAISIAASGDALQGEKVVLITSPQSYVPEGIAPDLFMANFSPQQYLELLQAEDLLPETKRYISSRIDELLREYAALPNATVAELSIRLLAKHEANPGFFSSAADLLLTPYYNFSRYLYNLKDKISARELLDSLPETEYTALESPINWEIEEKNVLAEAERMTSNNSFGMLDNYFTTYIGSRLSRQKDRDAALDYSVSKEYDDLRVLFEVCKQKGIEPLFIHVPLHGQWSDYTGFTSERRQLYYSNVRKIAEEYGVEILDLTEYEYEPYFLCDVMHLGCKGWLKVDQAIIDYYNKP